MTGNSNGLQLLLKLEKREKKRENSKTSGKQKELPKKGCEFYRRVTRNLSGKDLTDWCGKAALAHCALKF